MRHDVGIVWHLGTDRNVDNAQLVFPEESQTFGNIGYDNIFNPVKAVRHHILLPLFLHQFAQTSVTAG